MTNLEALQSMTEYSNDNLLEKILTDHSLTTSGTYGSQEDIDLCAADLYFVLAAHPDLKEGSLFIKYNSSQLRVMAKVLQQKYASDAEKANVDGMALW